MRFRDLFRTGTTTASPPPTRAAAPSRGSWVPPGGKFVVAGREIRSGMVYSGRGLAAVNGYDADPALIDPTLRVNWRNPDTGGHRMGYWPSYSRIAAVQR